MVPGIRISLLGPFSCTVDGREVEFPTRGAERLLAYLLLRRGKPMPRRKLAGMLWPDSDDLRASRNLNTTLWRVKRTFQDRNIENFRFHSDQTRIIAVTENVDIDAVMFQEVAASISAFFGKEKTAALITAANLYGGDLLEGLDDEWILAERSNIRNQYVSVLRMLVDTSLNSGNYHEGLNYARKLTEAEPLDEDGHRAVMFLSFLSGNRSGALAQYRSLKHILSAELGVEPSQKSTDLWLQIRSEARLEASRFVMVE